MESSFESIKTDPTTASMLPTSSNTLMSSLTSNHSKSSGSFGILGSPAQVPKAIGPESPKIDDQQTHGPTAKATQRR